MTNGNYEKITQLTPIEQIRKRPGMWIGTTENPSHLFAEVLDNSLDEAANGYANKIKITYKNNTITIEDNGRGIPHTKTDAGEYSVIAVTDAFSGGKFDNDAYSKAKIGLHGVGLCAVRALSKSMTILSRRKGNSHYVEFSDSKFVKFEENKVKEKDGTIVSFEIDPVYFDTADIPESYIKDRCKIAVTEIPELKVEYNGDEILPFTVEELIGKCDIKLNDSVGKDKTNSIKLIFGYTSTGINQYSSGSVNLLPVHYGTHIDISNKAIAKAWKDSGLIENLGLQPNDVLIGSHLYVSSSFLETAWTSQDKTVLRLKIKDYEDLINSLAKAIQKNIADLSKDFKQALVTKFKDYRDSQNRLSSTKYVESVVKYGDSGEKTKRSFKSDSKLVDCISEDKESTELLICEGDSAGSNLLAMRNPKIHAVLPLRGKPKNIMDEGVENILNNLEMRSIVNALGTGLMKHEKPELCRYGKIIVATDADVDGANIASLVIGALCYLVPQTVLSGKVYIVQAPLYGQYINKQFVPYWKFEDIKQNVPVKYYKGLGSLSPNEAEVSLLSDKRQIKRITGVKIQEVIRLVGGSEYKKALMRLNDIIDWEC